MHPLRVLDHVRRRLLIHRRGLGALLAAAAVWSGLHAVDPAAKTTPVWTAAADLPAGSVLERGDLRRAAYPADGVPEDAVRSPGDAVGRTVLAPVPAGLPITGSQLLGARALDGYPGRSALAVRVDPAAAGLLRPGDRIALVAGDPQGATPAEQVTDDALVMTVPREDPAAGPASAGRLVVLAIRPREAAGVAAAAVSRFLTVLWTH